jgi:hypothetical protein
MDERHQDQARAHREDPSSTMMLGPRKSISRPTNGVTTAETRNPKEKASGHASIPPEFVEDGRKQQ